MPGIDPPIVALRTGTEEGEMVPHGPNSGERKRCAVEEPTKDSEDGDDTCHAQVCKCAANERFLITWVSSEVLAKLLEALQKICEEFADEDDM